jgi:hypothetical protein
MFTRKQFQFLCFTWFFAVLTMPPVARAQKQVSSPEDLVVQHLVSIGKPEARSGAKSRMASGTARYRILVGGAGTIDGKSVFVSEGQKFHFMVKFMNNDYRGETFISDGKKIQVSSALPQAMRSTLGDFLWIQDAVLREGLWGGTLSTAWPLLALNEHQPKLTYQGIKNVDGRSMHDLLYRPKQGSDLEIHLFFDSETCRHLKSVYTLTRRPSMVHVEAPPATGIFTTSPDNPIPRPNPEGSELATARQQETRLRLEERFSQFQEVNGLTLPTQYKIHLVSEQQNGSTTETEWDIQESELTNNIQLDPRNFEVR